MNRDAYGRTRIEWAFQWGLWWMAVLVAGFLTFQLSRPLWDAPRLIEEKRQSCVKNGMVLAEEKVKFGVKYYCATPSNKKEDL